MGHIHYNFLKITNCPINFLGEQDIVCSANSFPNHWGLSQGVEVLKVHVHGLFVNILYALHIIT